MLEGARDGVTRFVVASDGFAARLARVGAGQWTWPTPCTDWDVRALVNHVTQANLNYVRLLDGASAAEATDLAPDASTQDRLLHVFGRDLTWSSTGR